MRQKNCLLIVLLFTFVQVHYGHVNPTEEGARPSTNASTIASFRADCALATAQVDLDVNNVRARLLNGGDLWWDANSEGRYIVPKVDPASGLPEVSSLFAGAVWLGGFDGAGNLKVAAQTYGSASGNTDFWPGPLTDFGTVEADTCLRWDRFFEVTGDDIRQHLVNWNNALESGETALDPSQIPASVLGWPARGNEFFFEINGWELPFRTGGQGLANFFDVSGNGIYEPQYGDYPVIEVRGCEACPQYPDEMQYWIYNDAGGVHTQSTNSKPIQMEVQVQAFAIASNDEVNNMTFYRYKLINRAIEDIDSCFFAMWVDPDLGCASDDYVGCDVERSLAYVYNQDAVDGTTGPDCGSTPTYGDDIPMIGIDYFRGPLDENANEIGMSSFTYYNNSDPNAGMSDPTVATEYYNYLSGSWRDGTPFTPGGTGYDLTAIESVNYAFPGAPNSPDDWSMCSEGLAAIDRRTIQASGPFKLQPGAVNELIVGAVWVPNIQHPCPDITPLLFADEIAQGLFDNCFKKLNGPDAPDLCFLEMDKELVAVISNNGISNNLNEDYREAVIPTPPTGESFYEFEGYKLYQLAGPNISVTEFEDPAKARIVAQVDLKNGVTDLFNWSPVANPDPDPFAVNPLWIPTNKVEGADEGIKHTFQITSDQFSDGDRGLINNKKYYFTAVAYAHNNWAQLDPLSGVGQRNPYLEGRLNIKTYTVIPHQNVYENFNSQYGDGVAITRLDGVGAGGNFLEITDETRTAILDKSFDGSIEYKPGRGPIDIKIYNPLDVKEGTFQLTFVDENMANDDLDLEVGWVLTETNTQTEFASAFTIDKLNEQLISEYGFSVSIGQTDDVGDQADFSNGAIGSDFIYEDNSKVNWLSGITDGQSPYNFISDTEITELDPNNTLSKMGAGYFVPYRMTDWSTQTMTISPAWDHSNSSIVDILNEIQNLNNVDLVFTSNPDDWSRCVIVETANDFYYDELGIPTIGGTESFDLRQSPSVGKENDGEFPMPDGDGVGMGWFPGYAIDVETGKRLNVFFGENSCYNEANSFIAGAELYNDGKFVGSDMMFNPTSQLFLDANPFSIYNFLSGGQHFVYVHRTEYDECTVIREKLNGTAFEKVGAIEDITWTGLPVLPEGERMLSYEDGLIPNNVTVQLRVDNPYAVEVGTDVKNGYPTYEFKLENVSTTDLANETEVEEALAAINIVPNPYYGYSAYEVSQFTNTVKITNLPDVATVTIYTLDGKFIRQYERNENRINKNLANAPIPAFQTSPAVEWDLKNTRGIPVSSGTYIVHIDAPGLGERVIKWFGVNRQFDPSGL